MTQIKKLNRNLETEQEKFVFTILLYTGLRASELIHMTRKWIDYKRHFIIIPDEQICNCYKCKSNRKYLSKKHADDLNEHQKLIMKGYWVPKTISSARTIPIVPEARAVLYPFFKEHKTVMEIFPLTQYLNYTLTKIQKRCKIKLFPHCLRGTFATMLARKGFNQFEITDVMGWADINVAVFYIKLSGIVLKEAFEKKWSRDLE